MSKKTSSKAMDEKINDQNMDDQKLTIKVVKRNGMFVEDLSEDLNVDQESDDLEKNGQTSQTQSSLPNEEANKNEKPQVKKSTTKESTFFGDLLDFVKILAGCSICVLIFLNFIAHPVSVSGHSMDPSLADGEYGFTSIISVALSKPNRSDIVIINQENANGDLERWVKRVIGLPGETIEAKDGVVYIDGQPLDESSYLNKDYVEETLAKYQAEHGISYGPFTSDFGPVTLGEDEYWVMGDNRPYSKDSRYIGAITSEELFGKGMLVLYPFDKAGVK